MHKHKVRGLWFNLIYYHRHAYLISHSFHILFLLFFIFFIFLSALLCISFNKQGFSFSSIRLLCTYCITLFSFCIKTKINSKKLFWYFYIFLSAGRGDAFFCTVFTVYEQVLTIYNAYSTEYTEVFFFSYCECRLANSNLLQLIRVFIVKMYFTFAFKMRW